MTCSLRLAWFRGLVFAGLGITILIAQGCDTGGSKRDSQYQQLIGTWKINEVAIDEGSPRPFDKDVSLEFGQTDEARLYRVIRLAPRDTARQGRVGIPQSNVLRMTGGQGFLEWSFDFDKPDDVTGSVRFRLRGADDDQTVEGFARDIGLSGEIESLQLDLERGSE